MNPTKTITLTILGIVQIAILLTIIQLLLRKVKLRSETDLKLKSAYGTCFSGLLLGATLITGKAMVFLAEAIDNINKMVSPNLFFDTAKIASLYIGFSVLWFLIWYYISRVFSTIVVGARTEEEEMGLNNTYYFLIRGAILNAFIFSLFPVLELVFRIIMPNVQVPFIH